VADSSASEGTIIDDSAMSPIKILVPLVGDRVACPICEKREIHRFFMSLSDLGKRLDQHHLEAHIHLGCLYCEKNFPKLHGAKCHLPKCSGNGQNKE
jgi:DNA polymerase III alpha subunit (gram-positive type)